MKEKRIFQQEKMYGMYLYKRLSEEKCDARIRYFLYEAHLKKAWLKNQKVYVVFVVLEKAYV